MKNPFSAIVFILLPITIFGKDTLSVKDLAPHTHHFTIDNGQLIGAGAAFWEEECANNQYVLLGEYHGSMQLSRFTAALLPMLAKNKFNTFGIEVGPTTAQILNEIAAKPSAVKEQLKDIYNHYTQDDWEPIPFFPCVGDADFLKVAGENQFYLLGLDQEFEMGYEMLFDRMINNLSKPRKEHLSTLITNARDSMRVYYKMEAEDTRRMSVSMNTSPLIDRCFQAMSESNKENEKIFADFKKTNEIYEYNGTREYWKCNATRIEYMKDNFRDYVSAGQFDLKEDKMFVKMGAVHTGKGISPLRQYELGNLLYELSDFHDQQSLHIVSRGRFWMEDNVLDDAIANSESWAYNIRSLLQMAKKDEWTVIDLRPLKEAYFYHAKWVYEEPVRNLFRKHDVVLIPPVDQDCIINK